MTFEGQYLTKEEYIALGGNPQIEDMPFNLLEFEARRQIDSRTLNRLKNGENIPQEVKLCEYALINSINEFTTSTSNVASSGNIASENTDGYSVSYITSDKISDIVNSKQDEINNIIETYLMFVTYNGEHLMYIGV